VEVIVNVLLFEVSPNSGLYTVTVAEPAIAMSDDGMAALTWVVERYFVVRSTPFHLTLLPELKCVPFTISVNAGLPACLVEGVIVLIVGPDLISKVMPLDVPPPGNGLKTVTVAVPADAISAALTWAVS